MTRFVRHPSGPSPRAVFLGAYLALALLQGVQAWLGSSAAGLPFAVGAFAKVRGVEIVLGAALYTAVLAGAARVADPGRVGLLRHLAVALGPLAAAVALVMAVSPAVQRAAFGRGVVFHGSGVAKALAELIVVALAAALAVAYDLHRRYQAREAQALALEARLAEARLQALASRLQPHFLFNTLNAIAVILHRDPQAADTMLTRLADLLRATLQERDAHEIPLHEELLLLGRYLDIMRLRYGPRLTAVVAAEREAGDVLVPPFVLQPLVENALEHGIGRRAGPGTVTVTAAVRDDRLRLEVIDDGAGLSRATPEAEGVGLSTTRRRLEELYGDAQRLTLEPRAEGRGVRAVVELPARRSA